VRLFLPLSLLALALFAACSSNTTLWEGRDPILETLPVSSHPALAKAGLIHISEVDSSMLRLFFGMPRVTMIVSLRIRIVNLPSILAALLSM